jgi:hypothetical protein
VSAELHKRPEIPREQLNYANLLFYCSWIGLLVLIITYTIYLSGLLSPYIPISEIPDYWTMNVHDYVHSAQAPTGWGWFSMLKYGDFLNFLGIAFLAGLTVLCFLTLVPELIRRKDTTYLVICLLEVAVLTCAASGILKVGGH